MNAPEPESTGLCIEQTRLVELEAIVERGLTTFIEVGNALLEIRDSQLYRRTHATFQDYCQKRWGISRPQAYRLMKSAEVVSNLSPFGDNQPTSESQIRPIAKLSPALQREVWELATAVNPTPTAEHVARVAKTITKAIEDARADTTAAVNDTRQANPEKPNPVFDERWLQWIGALNAILRIDPFSVEAILEQQSRITDEDESLKRRFDEASTVRNRVQEFLTKFTERYPDLTKPARGVPRTNI